MLWTCGWQYGHLNQLCIQEVPRKQTLPNLFFAFKTPDKGSNVSLLC